MKVIFAGGGTGGHLYPAIAMAREILKRDPASKVLFIGAEEGIESRILPEEGLELKTLRIMGLKGKKMVEQLQALQVLPRALWDSFGLLRSFHPDAVVGVGGYASGPLVLAAFLSRRKTLLQEQNSIPGLTNRILGRVVDRIYTAYSESHSYFPKGKALQTGNPVRKGLDQAGREEAMKHFGLDAGKKTVLILGGSRGAHAINLMVNEMTRREGWSGRSLQFLHQTGEADYESVLEAYASSGLEAVVRPYIKEMDLVYAAADLAVSRAGAVALSEMCAAGVPMLLIPFPYAADDHQMRNACVIAETGAAEVLVQKDLGPEKLEARIGSLLQDPDRLGRMGKAALGHGRPNAAEVIVDDMERMLN